MAALAPIAKSTTNYTQTSQSQSQIRPAAIATVGRKRTREIAAVYSQDLGLVVMDDFHPVAAIAGAPGDPQWVATFLAQQHQQHLQIQQQFQNFQLNMDQMFQNSNQQFQHINARHDNSAAHHAEDPLAALLVTHPAGNALVAPAQFPPTLGALDALTGAQVTALLTVYGKPVPATLAAKRNALRHHIGVRRVVVVAGF